MWISAPSDEPLTWLLRATGVLQACFWQAVWVVAPIAIFAIVFHGIEAIVQRRLVERFGWRAALWTGWIGTPIHESSHALMCWVFDHRIESLALFEPDSRDGRLGYVRHTYQRGNWWQETGNFFIGLAPLAGGTVMLLLLTWMLYPNLVEHFLNTSTTFGQANASDWPNELALQPATTASPLPASGSTTEAIPGLAAGLTPPVNQSLNPTLSMLGLIQSTTYAFGQLFSGSNLCTSRLWLFLYLTLCITSHMAPSSSDYQGAKKGGLLFLTFWLMLNILYGMLGMSMDVWTEALAPIWQLVFAMLLLAMGLGFIVSAMVFTLTVAWDWILQSVHAPGRK